MIRLALACLVGTAAAVVPLPLSFELHPGSLDLAEGFAFRATGPPGAQSPTLAAALARFGSSLDVIGGGVIGGGVIGGLKGCAVEVKSQSIELGTATDESYHLVVAATPSPICSISAANVFGAMHAMETFVQLVDRGGGSGGGGGHPGRMRVPLATVSDRPRFALRATMIDTSRHFLPVENILLHLDAMSCTKMNLLHWHLVDSQSWPYVSMAFPRLAEHGAYGPLEVYTPADIARVVSYANHRGIMVMPEIDTPGHVWAGLAAIEPAVLTTCFNTDGTVAGTGNLDPSKESTFSFLETLLAELIPLFRSGMFMAGGDEVQYDCWASNPAVRAFTEAKGWGDDMQKLESFYAERLLKIVAGQNASVMCWEDMFNNGLVLSKDALINVWSGGWEWCDGHEVSGSTVIRNNQTCSAEYGTGGPWFGKMHVRDNSWTKTMAKAAAAGYQTILSSPFYLNAENAGSNFDEVWPYYYAIEPTAFQLPSPLSGGSRADQRRAALTQEEKETSVRGVEACLWASWVNKDNFGNRFWPAAAAVAERGWSAKEVTSIDDFRRRLHALTCELQRRGLPAEPAIFGGQFFYSNGTACRSRPGSPNVQGPVAPGCLPRFSSCAVPRDAR